MCICVCVCVYIYIYIRSYLKILGWPSTSCGFMWDFQLNPKSSPLISMCVLHLHENMVVQHVHSTVRETQPLHTQQDKIVPRKHPITPPGISLALRESLRCGGTRPFSTLKKPSNKCKTTRQRSSKKSS